MSRNRLPGLCLVMLVALFLAISMGTSVLGSQPGQRAGARALGRPPAADPAPPGDGRFVGPDSPSYRRLTPTAKDLYAVMREIFGVRTVGGWRETGSVAASDHPKGRAIDAMVDHPSPKGRALGWRIAKWAVANAGTFDVKYVIFNGRIWTSGRGWHGYRHPSDPCNCDPTLRHDDHVHISVRR
jgi:hypothetical protein